MLQVIRIIDGLGIDRDLFLYKSDGSDGSEGEIVFMDSEEEVGQYAGDTYNWDDGEPETYNFDGSLEDLFEFLKAKSSEDEAGDWIQDYV